MARNVPNLAATLRFRASKLDGEACLKKSGQRPAAASGTKLPGRPSQMPDTTTTTSRLLTVPPDMDHLSRNYPWIFRAGDVDESSRRYLLLYTERSAPYTPEIYSYSFRPATIASDIRYWSHRNSTTWGVWDCQNGEYVSTDYACECIRCQIRDGAPVAVDCAQCDENFELTADMLDEGWAEWSGAYFCSQECQGDYQEEQQREEARQNGYMRGYSYKPRPNFLRVNEESEDESLFFGFELELPSENRTYLSSAVYEGPGQAERVLYCKDDSSIYGAEVVSHPMTHRYFRESLDMSGLFGSKVGRHVDGTPDAGYGLHVHVSRAGFKSQAHALRWLLLIYRNSDEMARLSRRSAGQWSTFRDIEACEEKARHIGAGDRYTAVNAQNRDTFEVRCFRSTYTEQEFRAAVDFCHASVVYTRSLNNNGALKGDALTWAKFRAWVDERPEYEHLTKELTRVALVTMPRDEDDDEDDDSDNDYDDSYNAPRCNCPSCRASYGNDR